MQTEIDNKEIPSPDLFCLSNGRYIMSEELSEKMFHIKEVHPETNYSGIR